MVALHRAGHRLRASDLLGSVGQPTGQARLAQAALRPRVKAAPRYTAGPPKRFAAAIGAALTIAATVLWIAGTTVPVVAIGVVMVVFPALEALGGICVGCIVFGWLMRAGLIPDSVCVECADLTRRAAARQAESTAQL